MSETYIDRINAQGMASEHARLFPPLIIPSEELTFAGPDQHINVPAHDELLTISRREFLSSIRERALQVGAAALVVQYGAMAETISNCANDIGHAEDQLWPKNKPSLTFLDEATYNNQEELTVYLPGFGDMHSVQEASLWKQSSQLSKNHLVGAIDYSNEGTSINGIVNVLREGLNDLTGIQSINFVCRSIGGLYALPVAAELGIPVKSMLLISCPSRLSNGDFGNIGKAVANVPRRRWLSTLAKFSINAYYSVRDTGFDPGTNIAEGWKSTLSGANPDALQVEAKTAASIDIRAKSLQPALKKVFKQGFSEVAYAATDYPRSDETVRVTISGKEFAKEFHKLGIDFNLFGIPYRGHADVEATSLHMKGWTQKATSGDTVLASK